MGNLQEDFIEFMLAAGALRFGDFTTKSGRKTPYFINTGAYVKASQLEKLGEFYAHALFGAHGDGVDNLFGPAYKGIPLAVTAALALRRLHGLDVSYTFNRKEPKDHGEGGALVGLDYAARSASGPEAAATRVVLIEDVTTAGTSVRECMPLITGAGAKVVGLVVSVDRMERGQGALPALKEIENEHGIKTTAIVSFLDLLAYLESGRGTADLAGNAVAGLIGRMKEYHHRYGAR